MASVGYHVSGAHTRWSMLVDGAVIPRDGPACVTHELIPPLPIFPPLAVLSSPPLLTSSPSRPVSSRPDPVAGNLTLTLTLTPPSMASSDDDFALLGDDAQSHHHHHHHHHPPPATAASFSRYATKPPKKGVGNEDDDQEGYGEAFAPPDASINPHHHCFPNDGSAPNPFARSHADDAAAAAVAADRPAHPHDPTKRKDREELSDGESPYCFNTSPAKKSRPIPSSSGGERDYRKDREEWSDSAIGCLLDAYTDKYVQLNRGNLRGRDWEDVATTVSERCDKQKSAKSVEQCKNKVDNLKKRYKVECHRLNSGSHPVSHWPWFKKMEQIVGSSSSIKVAPDDDKSAGLGGSAAVMRQIKRYPVSSPGSVSLTNNFKMKSLTNPRWKRVVLKISGSVLIGSGPQNVDPKVITLIAKEIAMANRVGVEVAVVVGGRNFFCSESWVAATSIDRATAYQIGMMASAMNSMLLQGSLEKIGVEARVQTGFTMQEMSEPYIRRRAIRHLEKGRVVIFGGISAGTGNPLFTTDTAAALRASEIHADAVLKGTNVDSVYDCHSRNSAGAFEHISFRDLVSRGLTAMDTTAITFCGENNIPVVIFNLLEGGNLSRALCGDQVGTLIDQSGRIS